jgi:ribosome-associated toxin RatA of RatAB toxin-antitoxin module
MFDETCKLLQMLKASLEIVFAKFTEWQLIRIVADLPEHRIEVNLVEDELHQTLSWHWELTLDNGSHVLSVVVSTIIVFNFVSLLDESVLLGFGCRLFIAVLPINT